MVLTHLHGVLKTMGGRGRKKRGRRTKDDTSRFIYLVHVALPNLLFGKLPSVEDWTALFMPHSQAIGTDGKLLNSKAGLKFLETSSKKVHPDPPEQKGGAFHRGEEGNAAAGAGDNGRLSGRGVSGVLPPFPVSLALSPVLVLFIWVLD